MYKSIPLLTELASYVQQHLAFAEALQDIEDTILQQKTSPKSWSVLECVQHLNL